MLKNPHLKIMDVVKTMLQMSKVIQSRDEWKNKAIKRSAEIREYRKTQKRHLATIAELKQRNREAQQTIDRKAPIIPVATQVNKTTEIAKNTSVVDLSDARQLRVLCVLLTIDAVVSYRSVPRILDLFKRIAPFEITWIPHFTSVINWTLRLGLGLLKHVKPISNPWVAVIDHSIDIGTKKALVVLRIDIATLAARGSAIQLKDCECIGLKISEKVTGNTLLPELEEIFAQAGRPVAIIKDADATLNKGVRLWSEEQEKPVHTIEDIGHAMANALKSQFEKTAAYKNFTALVSHGAKCLRQTDLAFLIPPKLRSKGRFQSISNLGKWGEKMLDVFAVKGCAKNYSLLNRLRTAFPDFLGSRDFIERFALTTTTVSQVMEILKNKGLNKVTYKQCYELSKELPKNSKVKKRLQDWLQRHINIQEEITSLPLLVSSDIIESLFGNFKHIIARSPQADMNRTALLIPALCGRLDDTVINQALSQASHLDLEQWEETNIPYTVRKKRQDFFRKNSSQKAGQHNSG